MSTYPVDIKATNFTAAGAGQVIFNGPARILAVHYDGTVGQGTIDLKDDATTVCSIPTHAGGQYMQFPGTGIKCSTSAKVDLTTVNKVTIIYG